ncbi:MAG: radical SAM protein [Bacteroidales bacterium]|nr:radical SAM protein [Bacteroidales bacterium]
MEQIHFTGQVWRPPFEANSVLLQATAGCSHNSCRFCSLYHGTKFRPSPFSEIEHDLQVIQKYQPEARRIFLTGANPFVFSYNKLVKIALLIRRYLPNVQNIGGFARITDIKTKSLAEWKDLRRLGYDRIAIGTETGDDITLLRMKKGYTAKEILEQCIKLQEAGIEYNITYLNGLGGMGNGERNALETAKIYSQIRPFIISVVSLTVFPESELYQEIQEGEYIESSEHERLEELHTLISNLMLDTPVTILANTVSNPVPLTGLLPYDRQHLTSEIRKIMDQVKEEELKNYRMSIKSL